MNEDEKLRMETLALIQQRDLDINNKMKTIITPEELLKRKKLCLPVDKFTTLEDFKKRNPELLWRKKR